MTTGAYADVGGGQGDRFRLHLPTASAPRSHKKLWDPLARFVRWAHHNPVPLLGPWIRAEFKKARANSGEFGERIRIRKFALHLSPLGRSSEFGEFGANSGFEFAFVHSARGPNPWTVDEWPPGQAGPCPSYALSTHAGASWTGYRRVVVLPAAVCAVQSSPQPIGGCVACVPSLCIGMRLARVQLPLRPERIVGTMGPNWQGLSVFWQFAIVDNHDSVFCSELSLYPNQRTMAALNSTKNFSRKFSKKIQQKRLRLLLVFCIFGTHADLPRPGGVLTATDGTRE